MISHRGQHRDSASRAGQWYLQPACFEAFVFAYKKDCNGRRACFQPAPARLQRPETMCSCCYILHTRNVDILENQSWPAICFSCSEYSRDSLSLSREHLCITGHNSCRMSRLGLLRDLCDRVDALDMHFPAPAHLRSLSIL